MCSLALGALVILNAQFGCDAPASTAPPPSEPEKKIEPAKTEPAKTEPATTEPAKVEPAVNTIAEPEPTTAANVEPPAKVEPAANAAPEPVYMPASKSGGDFGRMQFPGQANPAPEPQQQAPQK